MFVLSIISCWVCAARCSGVPASINTCAASLAVNGGSGAFFKTSADSLAERIFFGVVSMSARFNPLSTISIFGGVSSCCPDL